MLVLINAGDTRFCRSSRLSITHSDDLCQMIALMASRQAEREETERLYSHCNRSQCFAVRIGNLQAGKEKGAVPRKGTAPRGDRAAGRQRSGLHRVGCELNHILGNAPAHSAFSRILVDALLDAFCLFWS